jgi:hypothetical protein
MDRGYAGLFAKEVIGKSEHGTNHCRKEFLVDDTNQAMQ